MKDTPVGRAICLKDHVDRTVGEDTWYWPLFPKSKCKPAGIMKFESGEQLFNKGSHIPIIAFIGDAMHRGHSAAARGERDLKAKYRGPGYDFQSRKKREKAQNQMWGQQWGQPQQWDWSEWEGHCWWK